MPKVAVDALRNYLKGDAQGKKGRLIVLTGVQVAEGGKMIETGLEPLLAEYGVKLGDNRILTVDERPRLRPGDVIVGGNPDSPNPIAQALDRNGNPIYFRFSNVRTVDRAEAPAGGASVESMMVAFPTEQGIWVEKDLAADPDKRAADLRLPANQEERKRIVADRPVSVAVAVTESRFGGPRNPHDFMNPGGGEQQPRLIVFGSMSWVTNQAMSGREAQNNGNLFSTCLSWLRERPDLGIRPAKGGPREVFTVDPDVQVNMVRLTFLPGILLLLSIVVLGGGIWVVRRR
jgi:hypothetical protein